MLLARSNWKAALFAALLLLVSGVRTVHAQAGGTPPAGSPATQPSNSDAFAGPIRPNDTIRVVVADADDLSGDFRVEKDGSVLFPQLGSLIVGGKMQADAASDIAHAIVGKQLLKRADVAVYIIGRKTRLVSVNGAVTNQGQQQIRDSTVLSEVLETAIPLPTADLSRVLLEHSDSTSQTVNYLSFRVGTANTPAVNPALQDGDKIYVYSAVPSSGNVRVVGEVKDQTRIVVPIEIGMTVGQVLQMLGGVTDYADRTGITVLRGTQRIPVPYDDILRHTPNKDVVLQNGDEIDVPKLDKPHAITVAGAVREPKSELLVSRLTLLEAVGQAGGPMDGAQQNKVELRRRDSAGNLSTHVYDLGKDSDANTELIDGDYVFLPYPRQRQKLDAAALIGILSGAAVLYSVFHH